MNACRSAKINSTSALRCDLKSNLCRLMILKDPLFCSFSFCHVIFVSCRHESITTVSLAAFLFI